MDNYCGLKFNFKIKKTKKAKRTFWFYFKNICYSKKVSWVSIFVYYLTIFKMVNCPWSQNSTKWFCSNTLQLIHKQSFTYYQLHNSQIKKVCSYYSVIGNCMLSKWWSWMTLILKQIFCIIWPKALTETKLNFQYKARHMSCLRQKCSQQILPVSIIWLTAFP